MQPRVVNHRYGQPERATHSPDSQFARFFRRAGAIERIRRLGARAARADAARIRARDIYDAYGHIDQIKVKTRDFK
jgi:hypothetical protein